MTVQDFANEFHTYEITAETDSADMYEQYNTALEFASQGEFSEAKSILRKVVRMDATFDDGNMLLGLVLFSMGNRIDGMKRINAIEDGEKHERALRYVDKMSGADEPERRETEKPKPPVQETIAVDFKDEATDEKQDEKPQQTVKPKFLRKKKEDDFSERYKKAKEAQKSELEQVKIISENTDSEDEKATLDTITVDFDRISEDVARPEEIHSEDEPSETEPEKPKETVRADASISSKNIFAAIAVVAASTLVLAVFAAISVVLGL